MCIWGDFNARIEGEGKRCEEKDDKKVRRSTRDKEINRKERKLKEIKRFRTVVN